MTFPSFDKIYYARENLLEILNKLILIYILYIPPIKKRKKEESERTTLPVHLYK